MKGRSLMVCLEVEYGVRTSLLFLNGRQKHADCIKVLNSELLPYASKLEEKKRNFNKMERLYTPAKRVKNCFVTNNMQILSWPAKSPDLKVVETFTLGNAGSPSICWWKTI